MFCGCSSVVEHYLAKVEVVGSTPDHPLQVIGGHRFKSCLEHHSKQDINTSFDTMDAKFKV